MKRLIVFLMFFSLYALADNYQAQPANYFYLELVPKEKLVLTFTAETICDLDKFIIQDFEATKNYPSVETKKEAPVRVKTIIANSVSPCSSLPKGKMEEKMVIGPFKSQMTHIHITALNGLKVSVSQDCGMVPPGATFDKDCKIVPVPPPQKSKK